MNVVRWTCALAYLLMSSTLFASTVDGITVSHFESLERVSFEVRGVALQQKLQPVEAFNLRFDAMGRSFDLELEPNTALMTSASRSALPDGIGVYRGRIANAPESWTRMVVVDGVPRGLIWDGNELFAVEAPDDGILNSGESVMYRFADVNIAPGVMSCGTAEFSTNGNAMYKSMVGELRAVMEAQGPGAVDEIRFGAIGDFEFTSAQGANAAAAITTRLNNVDGIFSQQLAVQITADSIETYSNSSDPFTDETASGALLTELANYRFATPAQNQQGLTHLFTGKDLDGTTAGVAFVNALCSTRFGAGLAEARRGSALDSLISAHEIGHNFGANHDGDAMGNCPNESLNFLMAPSVGVNNNTFSPCSVGVMQAAAAVASCVTALPSVDMTVSTSGQPASVLLGNAANLSFDVTNNGTVGATGVSADISLPNNVSFIAASASQGSCTNGASTVSCTLGSIGGSSGATITVTSATSSVGPAVFTATVSSDTDDNLNNNQTALQVSIDPAVNLIVTTPAAPQVNVDSSTSVSATLQNASSLVATGVTVSVTLDAGIRADSASWSAGSCSVAAQQVDCTAASIAAQTSSALTLGVTGTVVGTPGYTVTMAANEADTTPADNSVSGSVNVTAAGSGNGGGNDDEGGGAIGVLFMGFLASMTLIRRRRIFDLLVRR